MKIIISPDSFKGSLSALDAATAIDEAIKETNPSIDTVLLPIADGGEGTLEAFIIATQGTIIHTAVHDPLGRLIQAGYGVLGDRETCVIEVAKASGITLLTEQEKDPFIASTFGTGELILHALDSGYRKFIIGLGGSATNDGGVGMLCALGLKLLDKNGVELTSEPQFFKEIYKIDSGALDKRIKECKFIIASDVDNPYVGVNGATSVFGPQKGVTIDRLKELDEKLVHLANKIEEVTQISLHNLRGAGAAGGLGGAFLAFFPCELRSGIEVVLEVINFQEKIKDADFIITGEGKSDQQTLYGKAPIGIAKVGKKNSIPVILISGYIAPESITDLSKWYFKLVSITNNAVTSKESMNKASYYLKERTIETIKSIQKSGIVSSKDGIG